MRTSLLRWAPFLVALCVPAGLPAQSPDKTTSDGHDGAQTAAVVKPVRKPDQVITNDSIALLAVRRAPRIVPVPAAVEPQGTADSSAARDAAARLAAEITALEKQVQEKQKRITLLIRLFVNDEREFLRNPGAAADPVVQERRRYEQDELRWETAEVARLQAKLEELKAGNRH